LSYIRGSYVGSRWHGFYSHAFNIIAFRFHTGIVGFHIELL